MQETAQQHEHSAGEWVCGGHLCESVRGTGPVLRETGQCLAPWTHPLQTEGVRGRVHSPDQHRHHDGDRHRTVSILVLQNIPVQFLC